MLTRQITDARAWTADTVGEQRPWRVPLDTHCLDELTQQAADPLPPVRDGKLPSCRTLMAGVAEELEHGRGFVLIDRLPLESLSAHSARRAYWRLGQLLGPPFAQDVKGTLLFDVRDTGRAVSEGARFSVTNAESSFHTDGAFNPAVPDYVALLCVRAAQSGGVSQLVSACAIHNRLLDADPEALALLYEPFCFDRRSEFIKGEKPYTETPIFQWRDRQLVHRYLRHYVEVGQEKAGQPLRPAQVAALDIIETLVTDPAHQAEFAMAPGQMLFTNNRWILHNRTAFVDWPEPGRRRHYVRLWLTNRG